MNCATCNKKLPDNLPAVTSEIGSCCSTKCANATIIDCTKDKFTVHIYFVNEDEYQTLELTKKEYSDLIMAWRLAMIDNKPLKIIDSPFESWVNPNFIMQISRKIKHESE
jgi:hypothetical protein